MIKRLEHAALSVGDLDRSLAFYREVLGFELVRLLEPREDGMLGTIAALPGARARIAHLELGGRMLELFEYIEPRGAPRAAERTQADTGYIHVGLCSDDVPADFARLKQRGVAFLSDPVEFRPGVWVVYFRGPDGEVCELRQT